MSTTASLVASLTVKDGTTEKAKISAAVAVAAGVDFRVLERVEVPALADNQEISLGGLTTGKALLLQTDQSVQVRLNANDATEITVNSVLLLGGDVSALFVSNDGSNAANLEVLVAGA